jgi:hypothetical protein
MNISKEHVKHCCWNGCDEPANMDEHLYCPKVDQVGWFCEAHTRMILTGKYNGSDINTPFGLLVTVWEHPVRRAGT